MNPLRQLDDRLFLAINDFARRTPWLHGAMPDDAKYGVVLFGLLLVFALVATRHAESRRLAASGWACLAPLIGLALNQPLGHLFHEARPYASHPQVLRLVDVTTDFSFPSDHSVMAGAVAAGLLLATRRLGLTAVVLAALLAFARLYVGAHYPWDVLAGLAVGVAVAWAGWWVLRRPLTALTDWLRGWPGLRLVFSEREEACVGQVPSVLLHTRRP